MSQPKIIMSGNTEKGEINTFTLSILLIGIFAGLMFLFFMGGKTLIRIDTVFNMIVVAGALVFVLHLPFLKKLNRYLAEMIAYSFLGWGFIIVAIIMGLNFMIHDEPQTDTYIVVTATAHPEERELPFPVSVTISDQGAGYNNVPASAYHDFPGLLKFKGNEEQKFDGKPIKAKFMTAKGLFGYRVVLNKELD